jgi:hypothetical protein
LHIHRNSRIFRSISHFVYFAFCDPDMRHSLQAIFASGFFVRTGSAEEIIVIADSADLSTEALHNRRRVGDQLRAALRRHAGDTAFMGALRGKAVAWGLEQSAAAYRNSEGLIELVVAAVARGRLMARILPVGVSHNEFATKGGRSIPRKAIERDLRIKAWLVGRNSIARQGAPSVASFVHTSQAATIGQSDAEIKSAIRISQMDPIEKVEVVLEGALPKLAAPVAKAFAGLLLAVGVTRLAAIIAAWAASQFVGIGEIIDFFLGAALVIGCLLSGWTLADGVAKLLDATRSAIDARSERDLDAASTKMAVAITTLGVAIISIALIRGTKTGAGGKVSGKSVSTDSAERVQLVDPEPQKLLPPGPSDRRLLLNPGPSNSGVGGRKVYIAPNGQAIVAPRGYQAVEAENGKGLVLLPEGQALGNNSNIIRYGEPNALHPNGYFRYYNKYGQPIDPTTGRPGPNDQTHIDPSYQGPLKGYPGR